MRSKDIVLLSIFLAPVLLLLGPAVFDPGKVPANYGDLYGYHYPLRHLVQSSLQSGRLPFWNPYIFGGLPLAANPQSVLFYPVSLLGTVLPLTLAFTWDYAFHLVWACLGVVLIARKQSFPAAAAWALGALYALSPFLTYRVAEGIPTLLASLSWAPWCWLAWLWGPPGLLAGVWSLQFLSGHGQFMIVNALGMALWAALNPGRRRSFGRLLAEGLPVMMLTAVQWMPTWEFAGRSVRRGWPEAFTTAYSLEPRTLWTWLSPGAFGVPWEGSYGGPPSVFFETSGVWIGAAGIILALAGVLRAARPSALLLAAAGVFLAMGGNNPLYRSLLAQTPLGFLRTPSRFLFLSLWGLVLAAAAGWRRFQAPGARRACLVVLVAAVVELGLWDRGFMRSEDAGAVLRFNQELSEIIGGAQGRVITDPELASPNKAMLYRAMNMNGYEAFYLSGFPEYAARSEGGPAADPSRSYLLRHETPEMARMGVRWFLRSDGSLVMSRKPLRFVHFVDAAGKPLKAPVELEIERPERWRAAGTVPDAARRLEISQPFYPGWTARLDGRPARILLQDGFLQALEVPRESAGRPFELLLAFRPTGWPLWVAFSAVSWAWWLWLWRRSLAAAGAA